MTAPPPDPASEPLDLPGQHDSPPTSARLWRRARTWCVLGVAGACTAYEFWSASLLQVLGIGALALLPVVPCFIAAIVLLVWVGRQGMLVPRVIAVIVGVFLPLSLPYAFLVTTASLVSGER